MILLEGHEKVVGTIYKMSHSKNLEQIKDLSSLKAQFLHFLSESQSYPVNFCEDCFIEDSRVENELAKAFEGETTIDDLHQSVIIGDSFQDHERAKRIEYLRVGLEAYKHFDPIFDQIFDLVVHSVFVKSTNTIDPGNGTKLRAYGGSSSNAIGSIWMSTNSKLPEIDVAELFIHELTHQLIFIDEFVNPLFNYEKIQDRSNYALSAIRGSMRPIDKVVHSIVVAAELLLSREQKLNTWTDATASVHPRTSKLADDVLRSCQSTLSHPKLDELMSNRAIDLVESSMKVAKAVK